MNKRVVPKVSGLVKVGSLTAAPEEEVQSLPDIPAESGISNSGHTTPKRDLASYSGIFRRN